jgi:uncharacterized protein DUF3553
LGGALPEPAAGGLVRRDGSRIPRPAGMPSHIEPGMRVRHPDRPDWGDGQVQSVIGDRVTVNFTEAGKVLVNAAIVELTIISDDEPRRG